MLMLAANDDDLFRQSAEVYLRYALAEQEKIDGYVRAFRTEELALYSGCSRPK
ncbi:Acyl-CoA dehydrogenase C-terminal domain-containing protein [Porphyromonas loveana]|uniref:Acyl-CoA dehydrogenase C-terminal domain-containing protein n=1 Tax=Porphyromonas loveana TaxID=1884669 RepID=UPI0035A17BE2